MPSLQEEKNFVKQLTTAKNDFLSDNVQPPNANDFREPDELATPFFMVGGGDEAGRGTLAGPVTSAIVILDESRFDLRINDSKQLSPELREELYHKIIQDSISYGIGWAWPIEIDKINILEATKLAFERAFEALSIKPNALLLDALIIPNIALPQKKIIKGDAKSYSIAAASILAKTARDNYMIEIDKEYPEYGFAIHKGYGTQEHLDAIKKFGPTAIHRMTFQPLRKSNNDQITFF